MSLAPLLQAPLAIQIHAFAALAAFLLGVVQLARREGDDHAPGHRLRLDGVNAVCGPKLVLDPRMRQLANFSLIHLLSHFTLAMLPLGITTRAATTSAGTARPCLDCFLARWSSPAPSRSCRVASWGGCCSAADRQGAAPLCVLARGLRSPRKGRPAAPGSGRSSNMRTKLRHLAANLLLLAVSAWQRPAVS